MGVPTVCWDSNPITSFKPYGYPGIARAVESSDPGPGILAPPLLAVRFQASCFLLLRQAAHPKRFM